MTEPGASAPTDVPASSRPGRGRVLAVAGTVGAVAVIGAGAWAWQGWLAQGPQAAQALPGDTLAYVAIDLDPPGGQKVEAYRTLRRFPSLADHLGLKSQDDLRRSVLDEVTEQSDCGLGYDDLGGWAGDRAALAVVPQKKPEPVAVVQVDDEEQARAGLDKVADSCGIGYAIGDGWAVIAESESVARRTVDDGRRSTLADDTDFRELTSAAGDAGFLTLYAAPEAGRALLDAVEDEPFLGIFLAAPFGLSGDPVDLMLTFSTLTGVVSGFSEGVRVGYAGDPGDMPPLPPEEQALWDRMAKMDELSPAEQQQLTDEIDAYYEKQAKKFADDFPDENDDEMISEDEFDDFMPPVPDDVRRQLESFAGIGGVARFRDGALEIEIVADPLLAGHDGRYDGTDALAAVSALPEDAAIAFGGGFEGGWAKSAVTDGPLSFGREDADLIAEFESSTGLTPGDLEELGGDAIAVVAAPGFGKALADGPEPGEVPIAVRISGDPERIEAALATLRTTIAGKGKNKPSGEDLLPSARTDGGVVIGGDRALVERIAAGTTSLASSDSFRQVVVDADDALIINYVDFNRGDWLTDLSEGEISAADLAPLRAAGMTVTAEGERQRILVRVAFDE